MDNNTVSNRILIYLFYRKLKYVFIVFCLYAIFIQDTNGSMTVWHSYNSPRFTVDWRLNVPSSEYIDDETLIKKHVDPVMPYIHALEKSLEDSPVTYNDIRIRFLIECQCFGKIYYNLDGDSIYKFSVPCESETVGEAIKALALKVFNVEIGPVLVIESYNTQVQSTGDDEIEEIDIDKFVRMLRKKAAMINVEYDEKEEIEENDAIDINTLIERRKEQSEQSYGSGLSNQTNRGLSNMFERYFEVAIVQDGNKIPIKDHSVELNKNPFSIILKFFKPDDVLINATFDPTVYDKVSDGDSLDEIFSFGGTFAEKLFNEDENIYITEDGNSNCWFYDNDEYHKFSSVTRNDEAIICNKRIKSICLEKAIRVKIEDVKEDALYLVFAKTGGYVKDALGYDSTYKIIQSEYLKIVFK